MLAARQITNEVRVIGIRLLLVRSCCRCRDCPTGLAPLAKSVFFEALGRLKYYTFRSLTVHGKCQCSAPGMYRISINVFNSLRKIIGRHASPTGLRQRKPHTWEGKFYTVGAEIPRCPSHSAGRA